MLYRKILAVAVIAVALLSAGCVDELVDKLSGSDSNSSSVTNSDTQTSGILSAETQEQVATIQSLGFDIVSDESWDDTAVRKVMHTFAYGGHAADQQIATWADMLPAEAIVEMLTFDEHNLKLSPVTSSNYDGLDGRDGTLKGLGEFWSSDDPQNGVNEPDRPRYGAELALGDLWTRASTSHGLNPFRQKIGLWETNYHMSTNLSASVEKRQMIRYYDDIMHSLKVNGTYEETINTAATSAAVAKQFGHFRNNFRKGTCNCNEDFAREYYQLYFGILGEYNPEYHETVTIKNTSKALTDMPFGLDADGFKTTINFGEEFHYPGVLEILEKQYWGANAFERMDQLSRDMINHPESLDNLPVKIISGLADDALDEAKIASIRYAWRNMQPKSLLTFLQAYAISTIYHSADRVKYLSSIDRMVLVYNKLTLDNNEVYLDLFGTNDLSSEDVFVFRPSHDVFGGQTGFEAFNSAQVFRLNYNNAVLKGYRLRDTSRGKYGRAWEKNWGSVIPKSVSGDYIVKEVGEWLWQRFIADGLKHFGPLERAHVSALLASSSDLPYLAFPGDVDRVITAEELETDQALIALVSNLEGKLLALDSPDTESRNYANERVGQAINFIRATPYIFVQEGR